MKKLFLLLATAFYLNTNAQIISTIAGTAGVSSYTGDGGPATAAKLYNPAGLAFDKTGNLFIADFGSGCIRKINTSGIISTVAGGGSSGLGDGGQATAAQLSSPLGITFDTTTNLYIADAYNYRVRLVNTSGVISTVAGNGAMGFSGDGGQATAAQLNFPTTVAIDAFGNLYIADTWNNRIRKVNSSGIITTIVGNGIAGYNGDNIQATAAELNNPVGVAIDALGNLYIADSYNNRVRLVNTSGIISTIAGTGIAGFSGDGGQAAMAVLDTVLTTSFDTKGNLYLVSNDSRIRKINTLGLISTVAGNGTNGFSGDGGLATLAEFYIPFSVAVNAIGNIYIADENNNCVRMIDTCSGPSISFTLSQNATPHVWDVYPNYSANITNATWHWGDGTSTQGLYPSHPYSVAGKYNICVTAFTVCGDSAQFCQNDSVYRYSNNSTSSNMVSINVINSTTGINQLLNSEQIQIYPNPASDKIYIEIKEYIKEIKLLNILGKEIINTKEKEIDINSFSEGIYFLNIKTTTGFYSKKVIVQH